MAMDYQQMHAATSASCPTWLPSPLPAARRGLSPMASSEHMDTEPPGTGCCPAGREEPGDEAGQQVELGSLTATATAMPTVTPTAAAAETTSTPAHEAPPLVLFASPPDPMVRLPRSAPRGPLQGNRAVNTSRSAYAFMRIMTKWTTHWPYGVGRMCGISSFAPP